MLLPHSHGAVMHIFYLIFFLLWCGDGDFVLRYLIFNVMIGLPLMFQLFPHISIIPNYFLMPVLRNDIFAFFKYLPVCNEFPPFYDCSRLFLSFNFLIFPHCKLIFSFDCYPFSLSSNFAFYKLLKLMCIISSFTFDLHLW